jgi:hypothetical protein
MNRSTLGTLTVRTSADTKEWFKNSFEASSANSQGDFLFKLLEKWNNDEPAREPEVKTITIEKNVQPNEILLKLTPLQLFALRGTVLSYPDFAERQNEIIDSLKRNKSFFYSSNLYDQDFHNVWIRNIVITKAMNEEQKESAIRHNMAAFLLNMLLVNIIDGNISSTRITAGMMKDFIRKQGSKKESNIELKSVSNEPDDKLPVSINTSE